MKDTELITIIAEDSGWIKLDEPKRRNSGFGGWKNYFWQSREQRGSSLAEEAPPNYPHDLNATQQAVLAKDEAFQASFNEALQERVGWEFVPSNDDGFGKAFPESWKNEASGEQTWEKPKLFVHQLTARDWCLCYVEVLKERRAEK